MKRLKYVSQWSQPFEVDDLIALVERSAQKNARLGITGILMTSGRIFFQVLEGPDAAVDGLYRQICADPRHQDLLLLRAEEGVSERIFPDWSMRVMNLDDHSLERIAPLRALLEELLDKRLEVDRLTLRMERALWEELAMRARGASAGS